LPAAGDWRSLAGMSSDANDRVADRDHKYYIFDWDNNILHMPTKIHLERKTDEGNWVPHSVSTSLFAVIRRDAGRYRPPGGDWEKAFAEFRDIPVDGKSRFLEDTKDALDAIMAGRAKAGPSFNQFRKALIDGRLFAIVTARGHRPLSIRAGVRLFIDTVLTADEKRRMLRNLRGYLRCFEPERPPLNDAEVLDYYLDINKYHPITSPQFLEFMGGRPAGLSNQEAAKQFAIKDFVQHVIRIARQKGITRPISVGFSDDDKANVAAVEEYIRKELAREFGNVKFVVYDTSDPDCPSGRKVVVRGQLSLPLAEGGKVKSEQ
jgi:hypothetical protein